MVETWTDPDPTLPPLVCHYHFLGLTPEQKEWAVTRVRELQLARPEVGRRLAHRVRLVVMNLKLGRVGNRQWGLRMKAINRRRWQEKNGTAYYFTAEDTRRAHETIKRNRELRKQGLPV